MVGVATGHRNIFCRNSHDMTALFYFFHFNREIMTQVDRVDAVNPPFLSAGTWI